MKFGNRNPSTQGQRIARPAPSDSARPTAVQQPDSGGPVSILDGDVQGDAQQNLVAKIQGVTAPAAVSADDQKFLKYDDASTSFVMDTPSVTLAGDVTGASGATVVGKIHGVLVDTPAGTGDVATFNGTKVVWSAPSVGGGGPSGLPIGVSDNISTGSGLAYVQMNLPGEFAPHAYPVTMFRAGLILGLSVDLTGVVGTLVGDNYTVQVYKDTGGGLASVACSAACNATAKHSFTDLGGSPLSFNAGDRLAVFHNHIGTVFPVASLVTLWVQY